MTAKELFESFGFKQTTNNDNLIVYRGDYDVDGFYKYIIFYRAYKEYEVGYGNIYQVHTDRIGYVTLDEYKAITKQMKELGWI